MARMSWSISTTPSTAIERGSLVRFCYPDGERLPLGFLPERGRNLHWVSLIFLATQVNALVVPLPTRPKTPLYYIDRQAPNREPFPPRQPIGHRPVEVFRQK